MLGLGLLLLAFGGTASATPRVGVYTEDAADPVGAAGLQAHHGLGLQRLVFDFRGIAAGPALNWSFTDRAVAGAALAGVDVIPTLVGVPVRMTAAPAGEPDTFWPPADPSSFGALAAAAVKRYGPDGSFWTEYPQLPPRPIRAWQIWNEPNIAAYWRPAPNPVAYAGLLAAAAIAVRAVDPQAEIVAAGLPSSVLGMQADWFLSWVYTATGAASFDSIAVHPYAPDAAGVLRNAERLRAVADRNGDTDAGLWVTELGWATGGLASELTVGERMQATLVSQSVGLLRGAAERLRLRGIVYFKWRDTAPPAGAPDIWPYHAGLLRADGSAKPALAALEQALAAPLQAEARPTAATGAPHPARLQLAVRVRRRAGGRVRVIARCNRLCSVSVLIAAERRRDGRRVRRITKRVERPLSDGLRVHRITVHTRRRPGERLTLLASALDRVGRVAVLPRRRVT